MSTTASTISAAAAGCGQTKLLEARPASPAQAYRRSVLPSVNVEILIVNPPEGSACESPVWSYHSLSPR